MIGCANYEVGCLTRFFGCIADIKQGLPGRSCAAHDRNVETLERVFIGRRFKNDTERLEELSDMYTKIATKVSA